MSNDFNGKMGKILNRGLWEVRRRLRAWKIYQ